MKNRRNYYRILHVQPDAPRAVIRSSYRTIMQKMRVHPDLGGDQAAAALVNEAYTVLNDEKDRSAYDRARQNGSWTRSANDSPQQELALTPAPKQRCVFCAHPMDEEQCEAGLTGFCRSCDSPLSPVSDFPAEGADRRVIARIPKRLNLLFCTRWPQPQPYDGCADDISLTGMCFNTDAYLAAEQTIKIDTSALKAVAQVVRCQQAGVNWEVGVRFLNLCFARARGSFVEERV